MRSEMLPMCEVLALLMLIKDKATSLILYLE